MRRRLSIGAQWTLRYTAALFVTVSILGLYTYSEVSSRTARDARLVLALPVNDLAAVASGRLVEPDDLEYLRGAIEATTIAADSDLKLGLQLFDDAGISLGAAGSLTVHSVALPEAASLEAADEVFRDAELGENYPYLVQTVRVPGGYVQGALYTRRFVRSAREVRDIYLYSIPVVLLLTAALGALLVRGILRPLKEINQTARRISGTHLEETVPTTGSGDELDDLAVTLNDMIARIRRSVDRMRRFSGNAAHELRTPLNRIRSRLDVTLEQPRTPEEYHKILSELADEVELMSNSVHGLMRLAQSEAGLSADQREPVALVPLLEEVVEFFEPLANEARVELVSVLAEPYTVPGDPSWLHQLFANLLHNAIKFTPEGGRVELELLPGEDRVGVRVTDTGIGIAPEEQRRIFEPFHRVGARPEAPGVGLGLPLAREIARAHGGELVLESELGKGSAFTVWLPVDGGEEGAA